MRDRDESTSDSPAPQERFAVVCREQHGMNSGGLLHAPAWPMAVAMAGFVSTSMTISMDADLDAAINGQERR